MVLMNQIDYTYPILKELRQIHLYIYNSYHGFNSKHCVVFRMKQEKSLTNSYYFRSIANLKIQENHTNNY